MVMAGAGVLMASNLIGNRFGWTMEDGNYGEVQISETNLATARDVVQAVLNAPWSWVSGSRAEWVP